MSDLCSARKLTLEIVPTYSKCQNCKPNHTFGRPMGPVIGEIPVVNLRLILCYSYFTTTDLPQKIYL